MDSVYYNRNKIFFLHGSGGTGKTFVYKAICHLLQSQCYIVLCVSSSGISALLLIGGRTSHFMFKIPISNLNEESFCNIPKESQHAELIRQTHLIIWDEAAPQHCYAAEAVKRTCRDLRNSDNIFGGITVVFGGDFQQTLPIVPGGKRADIIRASLPFSPIWKYIHILRLTKNMHLLQHSDTDTKSSDCSSTSNFNDPKTFAPWLLHIGQGSDLPSQTDSASIPLPPELCVNSIEDLISFVYHGIESTPPPPPEYFLNRTILAPRNNDVADANEYILNLMSGETSSFLSADEIINEAGADAPFDAYNPPHTY